MHPLVRGAAAAAVFTALGSLARPAPPPDEPGPVPGEPRGVDGLPAPCGPGTLPEGPVCLRIPGESEAAARAAEQDRAPKAAPAGEGLGADRIPRRPERPADPAAYVYPVGEPGRAPRLLPGGEAGVRIAARPGEKVVLLGLPGQEGPAEVVFVGDLVGRTVVTAHTVADGARRRTYLLFHGLLDRAAPEVTPGAHLEAGAVLGYARAEVSEGREGLIAIHLEARELREGARLDLGQDAGPPDGKRLTSAALAVPIDVRNVLPLRQ